MIIHITSSLCLKSFATYLKNKLLTAPNSNFCNVYNFSNMYYSDFIQEVEKIKNTAKTLDKSVSIIITSHIFDSPDLLENFADYNWIYDRCREKKTRDNLENDLKQLTKDLSHSPPSFKDDFIAQFNESHEDIDDIEILYEKKGYRRLSKEKIIDKIKKIISSVC